MNLNLTQPCVIACSATGGRHPIMLAILDVIENEVLLPLKYEPLRIGSSGGTLSSIARTLTPPGETSEWWLEKAASVGGAAKVGGTRSLVNLWNLIVHGGLLNSKKLVPVIEYMVEGDHINGKTAACMYSITSGYEARVLLDQDALTPRQIAEFITASVSLQVAMSPTEILNRSLPLWLQKKWDVLDHPDKYSACTDGGTGSYMPVSLRGLEWHVPKGTPVIGIALNLVGEAEYRPEGLVGSLFSGGSTFKKLFRSIWSLVGANATEDWEKAVQDNDVHPDILLAIPTPEHLAKYELRLDTSFEEAMEMYEWGVEETRRRLELPMPGTKGMTLKEYLKTLT